MARMSTGVLLLLVDDDPVQLEVLSELLQEHFVFERANSLAGARGLLRRNNFDVLITDYELPDGNGLELLKVIPDYTVMILVTAHTDLPDVSAAKRDRRIFRVALKPYDPKIVLGWVETAVKLSQMRKK